MYVRPRTESAVSEPDNRNMNWKRIFVGTAAALATPIILVGLYVAMFGWNWLKAPLESQALRNTGRVLSIQGDLSLNLAWPAPILRAEAVSFANPSWAQEKQMVTADAVQISVSLPQLVVGNVALPTVHLVRPVVFLEKDARGRKNWLLDRDQQDESSRINIGQLTLDEGTLGYDDGVSNTKISATISTPVAVLGSSTSTATPGVVFSASGQFNGLALKASGSGGAVLALRDESVPYPLTVNAAIGQTQIKATGTVTGLVKLSAIDMKLEARGDSLEQLYPLLSIPAPASPAYTVRGQLTHSGDHWRYQDFSGRVGSSDLAGSAQVVFGGKRPQLSAQLTSTVLNLGDLATVIGKRSGAERSTDEQAMPKAESGPSAVKAHRVLPNLPFKTDRWSSMDADVSLRAKKIRRPDALPLDDLTVHLKLMDSVLTLTPLDFGLAGGHLRANVTLDGRSDPIKATVQARVQKLLLSQIFSTLPLNETSLGEINGGLALSGNGNSVSGMLATSNGQIGLTIAHGEVSQLLMEKAGLHIFEILQLSLAGDKRIKLRCAVADFEVKSGVMKVDSLVFDTDVTTLFGSGNVDLGREAIDLTLKQKTKRTSPLALRSPIYVRGTFAQPTAGVDKGRVALRAAGAVALGLINPLLTIVPLIDRGPGQDSDCKQLIREAKTNPP